MAYSFRLALRKRRCSEPKQYQEKRFEAYSQARTQQQGGVPTLTAKHAKVSGEREMKT